MDSLQTNMAMDNETSLYKYIFTDAADPRTNDWFLISSPLPLIPIVLLYLYFVKIWGPNYMKDKQPYKLKTVLKIYNLLQVAANLWIFIEAVYGWSGYNWICQPIDHSPAPDGHGIRAATVCYWYFINKISDIMDTIFFVLRKKDNQISFLHVFHHSMMIFGTWTVVKYIPGGHGTFVGLLNSFVHVLLYTYYYLAAFGPKVQKYLWWKKYLTRIQLIQFALIIIHSCQLLVFECDYPTATVILTLPNSIFFYYLFHDFYQKSYTKEDTKSEQNGTTQKTKAG